MCTRRSCKSLQEARMSSSRSSQRAGSVPLPLARLFAPRSMRWWVGAAACMVGCLGCGSASSGGGAHAAPKTSPGRLRTVADRRITGPASCTARQLRVKRTHTAAGGASVTADITFTNTSATSCHLHGWPRVIAVRADRTREVARDVPAEELGSLTRGRSLILKPGEQGVVVIRGGDVPVRNEACADPFTALIVAPPNVRRSVRLSAWISYYGHYLPSCTPIQVSDVVAPSALPRG